MTIQLFIKNVKPFTEVVVQAKGMTNNITIGCKQYTSDELEEVRNEFGIASDLSKISRWEKQLQRIKSNIDLSDEEIDEQTEIFNEKIVKESKIVKEKMNQFYISQITHIKNASLQIGTEDKKEDLLIQDSREAKPVESLWGTPEECLNVLLSKYFACQPFRDSLHTKILETIFNYNFEENAVKN